MEDLQKRIGILTMALENSLKIGDFAAACDIAEELDELKDTLANTTDTTTT